MLQVVITDCVKFRWLKWGSAKCMCTEVKKNMLCLRWVAAIARKVQCGEALEKPVSVNCHVIESQGFWGEIWPDEPKFELFGL